MKDRNKRRLIIYGLLGVLMLTTVAYAALQTVLNVSGTVVRKGNLWNIYFTNASSASTVGSATGSKINIQASTLNFQVSLYKPGDKVTYTVDIKNGGTIDATLNSISLTGVDTAKSNNINYTVTYSDGSTIKQGDLLNIGASKTLEIVVEFDSSATSLSASDVNLTFGVTLIYNQTSGSSSSSNSGITSNNVIAGIYGNSIQNGTPTPTSPVEIESVGEKTKNLYNYYTETSYGATKVNNGFKVERNYIKFYTYTTLKNYVGQTATISFDLTTSEAGNFRIYQYQNNGIGIKFDEIAQTMQANVKQRINITGVVEQLGTIEEYSRGEIIVYKDGFAGTYTIENIQIELGSTATSYEPYGYKIPITVSNGTNSSTTNIYLKEPLRKIGEYADYLDLVNNKVVRYVKELTLNGTENWTKYTSVNNHYQLKVGDNYFSKDTNNILSNYYAPSKVIGAFYSNSDYAILSVDGERIRFKDKDVSTIEEWKSKVVSYNNSNKPLKVIYQLANETEENIEVPSIPEISDEQKCEDFYKVSGATIECGY